MDDIPDRARGAGAVRPRLRVSRQPAHGTRAGGREGHVPSPLTSARRAWWRRTLDIDLLTASLRADASDLGAFVEALAVKLEDAAPDRVRVDRRREGMFGRKLVRRISLEAGDRRLELRSENGAIDTRASRLSAGIVLDRKSTRL